VAQDCSRPLCGSQQTEPQQHNTDTPAPTNDPRSCTVRASRPHTHPTFVGDQGVARVSAAIARGKRPDTFRTRKLRLAAPMVLQGRPCGRVGHRRTHIEEWPPEDGWPFLVNGPLQHGSSTVEFDENSTHERNIVSDSKDESDKRERPKRNERAGERSQGSGRGTSAGRSSGERSAKRPSGDRDTKRPYSGGGEKRPYSGGEKRPYSGDRDAKRPYSGDRDAKRPYSGDRDAKRPYSGGGEKRPYSGGGEKRPY
jgi:hypothetical protein